MKKQLYLWICTKMLKISKIMRGNRNIWNGYISLGLIKSFLHPHPKSANLIMMKILIVTENLKDRGSASLVSIIVFANIEQAPSGPVMPDKDPQ